MESSKYQNIEITKHRISTQNPMEQSVQNEKTQNQQISHWILTENTGFAVTQIEKP